MLKEDLMNFVEGNGKVKTIETAKDAIRRWHVPPIEVRLSLGKILIVGAELSIKSSVSVGQGLSFAEESIRLWFSEEILRMRGGIERTEKFIRDQENIVVEKNNVLLVVRTQKIRTIVL
ncbi:MAG: hypothetical protein PHT82_02840 [Candidatus Portnoybacteria bacterium]|nr:hypothetical protein [Candidatus Portnoybacteria bacterium]